MDRSWMRGRSGLLACVASLCLAASASGAVVFDDNFDSYTDGALLGQGGWTLQNSTVNPIQVVSGQVPLLNTGQDLYKAFPAAFQVVNGTSLYTAIKLKVTAAAAGGDYFYHLSNPAGSNTFYQRLFARSSGSGYQLGLVALSGTGSTPTYGTNVLNYSQTYCIIIVWNFIEGETNDTFTVYVNPADESSPAYLTHTWNTTSAEPTQLAAANLRQGSSSTAPTLDLDDLLIGTTFADVATCQPPTQLAVNAAVSPSPTPQGSTTLLTATVTGGTPPYLVSGDLTQLGGAANQQFFDDGTNGDVTAGDKVFSFTMNLSCSLTTNEYEIPIAATDNASGSAQTDLTVTVTDGPPAITFQPRNRSVCEGATTTFSVTATGGNLTYQWYNANGLISEGGKFSGTTGRILTITGVTATEAAASPYFVRINGACAAQPLDSDNVTLSIDVVTGSDKQVVISQVYGGAGCGTPDCSIYKNDFVELYNKGTAAVNLNGWSVQYAAADGTFWSVTNLTNFDLQPGQYYLVQLSGTPSTNGTLPLPTPNVTGTSSLSATSGKVALVKNTDFLSGACAEAAPVHCQIVDFVGYGNTADCYEGTDHAPAPGGNSNSISRDLCSGTPDTDDNAADFTAGPANPHAGGSYASAGASPDFTGDSKVNLDDFEIFKACATGPAVLYDVQNLPVGCTAVPGCGGTIGPDLDQNGTVDMDDFGIFQRCFSGDATFSAGCLD